MSEIVDGIVFDLANLNTDVEAIRDMQEVAAVYEDCPLTGGSVTNIFSWAAGPILVTALVGIITEAVSADPCDLKLVMDPSVGSDLDLCAVLDIAGAAIGDVLYIDGVIANAMVNAANGVAIAFPMSQPLIIPRGTIDLNLANSDPTTGIIDWHMRYQPLESGILVSTPA